jgi:hypothetical protein
MSSERFLVPRLLAILKIKLKFNESNEQVWEGSLGRKFGKEDEKFACKICGILRNNFAGF